jgi:hypothetical protein
MNKLLIPSLFLVMYGVAASALAAPPAKSTILHCGCTLAGDAMVYEAISVNSKSRGHDAHVVGSIDSCFIDEDTSIDMVRIGADCQLGGPPLGDPIGPCAEEGPEAGDICGVPAI